MVVVRVFSYADHHREQVKEERGMNMQSKIGRRKCKVRNKLPRTSYRRRKLGAQVYMHT
jgi:hypothetical protein